MTQVLLGRGPIAKVIGEAVVLRGRGTLVLILVVIAFDDPLGSGSSAKKG